MLDETPPEHLTISRTRLIDLGTHRVVFTWVLATATLVMGNTIGVDATTLEANAALRSIMRRDSVETHHDSLTRRYAAGIAMRRVRNWPGSTESGGRRGATPSGGIRAICTRASRR